MFSVLFQKYQIIDKLIKYSLNLLTIPANAINLQATVKFIKEQHTHFVKKKCNLPPKCILNFNNKT